MTERAELMRIYRSNGISSISLMRDHYNKYDDGGDIQLLKFNRDEKALIR